MAALTTATIARRNARKAVKQQFAAAGIVLSEQQARFIAKTGVTVEEYTALRQAFGLHQPHIAERKAAIRRTRAYAAKAAKPAKVFVSTDEDYRAHVAQPGGDSAWVSRDGTFFKVNFTGHSAFAAKCKAAGIVTKTDAYGSYVGALEDIGWVHISGWMIRNKVADLTAEQASTLIAWAGTDSRADKVVRAYLQ